MTPHPEQSEIVLFGGEFYNGKETKMFRKISLFHLC